MPKKQDTLEKKYRMYVQVGCIVALVLALLIDAMYTEFVVPKELEVLLIAVISGMQIKDIRKIK